MATGLGPSAMQQMKEVLSGAKLLPGSHVIDNLSVQLAGSSGGGGGADCIGAPLKVRYSRLGLC